MRYLHGGGGAWLSSAGQAVGRQGSRSSCISAHLQPGKVKVVLIYKRLEAQRKVSHQRLQHLPLQPDTRRVSGFRVREAGQPRTAQLARHEGGASAPAAAGWAPAVGWPLGTPHATAALAGG